MTRGKYATKADGRLRVLESEALREATAKIRDLEAQLKEAKHELNTATTQMQSQAMQAAAHLSSKEKQHLRNQIASLENSNKEDRVRMATLVWDLAHRWIHQRPAPFAIPVSSRESHIADDYLGDQEGLSADMKQSKDLWFSISWEIAALFFKDYDDVWTFLETVEGRWRMSGDTAFIFDSGRVIQKTSSRENTRNMKKAGPMRSHMSKRIRAMQDYHERIWTSRGHGDPEPVVSFKQTAVLHQTPDDKRRELVSKLQDNE